MLKAFSAKHETKHCFVKANISFIKIWAKKNNYVPEKYMGRQTECQEMIHFLLSRLGLNGKHLMLSSSIFTGSRSSGSIWKTQQRQGNSWEGNWKGSKGARVVRLRLRFRRPVRIWGQWYQVKILTNNCFPFLWYSDILVWLFVQSSGKKQTNTRLTFLCNMLLARLLFYSLKLFAFARLFDFFSRSCKCSKVVRF